MENIWKSLSGSSIIIIFQCYANNLYINDGIFEAPCRLYWQHPAVHGNSMALFLIRECSLQY